MKWVRFLTRLFEHRTLTPFAVPAMTPTTPH